MKRLRAAAALALALVSFATLARAADYLAPRRAP
jgi:hypothetical protein